MFYKNLDSNSDKNNSSDDFCTRTNMFPEFLPEFYPNVGQNKSDSANHERRKKNICSCGCEWYPNSECIDAGGNTQNKKWTKAKNIFCFDLFIISLPSFVQHIPTDIAKK